MKRILLLALLLVQVTFVRLLGPFPKSSSITVGEEKSFCVYFLFSNNKVGMRARDAARCSTDFKKRYSSTRRSISAARQQWVDSRCIVWTSSNPAVAKVVQQETCPL